MVVYVVVVVDSVGAGAATGDSITLLFSVSGAGTFSTDEVVVVVVVVDSGELVVLIFSALSHSWLDSGTTAVV